MTAKRLKAQNEVLGSNITITTDRLPTYIIMRKPQLYLERPGEFLSLKNEIVQ